jgi:hypothetical protein
MLRNQTILTATVCAALSMGLMACNGGDQDDDQGGVVQNYAAPCANPISLDLPGQSVAAPGQAWQPQIYGLVELEEYTVENESNDSFAVDAQASSTSGNAQSFTLNVLCEQVPSGDTLTAALNLPQWYDGNTKRYSGISNELDVDFTNDSIATAQMETTQTVPVIDALFGQALTSLDNQPETDAQGNISYLSYRVYALSVNEVEINIKLTTGSTDLYGKAIYAIQN